MQENAAGWLLLALEMFPALAQLHLNHNSYSGQPASPLNMSRQASEVNRCGGEGGGEGPRVRYAASHSPTATATATPPPLRIPQATLPLLLTPPDAPTGNTGTAAIC